MRLLFDATSLLGVRTGVGRYTGHLLTSLARLAGTQEPPLDVAATAFTWRGREQLPAALPDGVPARGPRVPARLLHELWARTEVPRATWFTGDFDLLHAPNFVLPPVGRAAGVVTVHDLGYLRVPETVSRASARYRELVPRSIRRAELVLTPSRAIADELAEEYHLPTDRVVPTPLGVDPRWFSIPAQDAGGAVSLPERYLLFVGTVEPRKDLPTLLRAYRLLLDDERNGPDVPPLVLVGPSGWGAALDLAGVPADRVRSLGYLEEEALRPVVAGATALCFPSLYEGFGLPPLEALAAGTPVVASAIAATREVVGPLDGTGPVRLVPPRDPMSLAAALRSVLAAPRPDPEPGRRHAAGFTWDATAQRTLHAYRTALAHRASR